MPAFSLAGPTAQQGKDSAARAKERRQAITKAIAKLDRQEANNQEEFEKFKYTYDMLAAELNSFPDYLIADQERYKGHLVQILSRRQELTALLEDCDDEEKCGMLEELVKPLALEGEPEEIEEEPEMDEPDSELEEKAADSAESRAEGKTGKLLSSTRASGIFKKGNVAQRVAHKQERSNADKNGRKQGNVVDSSRTGDSDEDEGLVAGPVSRQSTGEAIEVFRPATPAPNIPSPKRRSKMPPPPVPRNKEDRRVPVDKAKRDVSHLKSEAAIDKEKRADLVTTATTIPTTSESIRGIRTSFLDRLIKGTKTVQDPAPGPTTEEQVFSEKKKSQMPPPNQLSEENLESTDRDDTTATPAEMEVPGIDLLRNASPDLSNASSDGLFVTDRRIREESVLSIPSYRSEWSVTPHPTPPGLVETQSTAEGASPTLHVLDAAGEDEGFGAAVGDVGGGLSREASPAVDQPYTRSVLLFGGVEGALGGERKRERSPSEEIVGNALGAFIGKPAPKKKRSDGEGGSEPSKSTTKGKPKGKPDGRFGLDDLIRKGGWGKRPH